MLPCFARAFVRIFLLLAVSVLASPVARANSLLGTTVSATLVGENGEHVTTPFVSSAVVQIGFVPEFTGSLHDQLFDQNFNVELNLGSNSFVIAISSLDGPSNASASIPLYRITLSGLPSYVTGFHLDTYLCEPQANFVCGSPALTPLVISNTFDASTLTLDFNRIISGEAYSFTVNDPPVAGTPEPASFALLATGLAGVAGFARRRVRVI